MSALYVREQNIDFITYSCVKVTPKKHIKEKRGREGKRKKKLPEDTEGNYWTNCFGETVSGDLIWAHSGRAVDAVRKFTEMTENSHRSEFVASGSGKQTRPIFQRTRKTKMPCYLLSDLT